MSTTPPSYFFSVVKLFDDTLGSRVDSLVDTASDALETASSRTMVKHGSNNGEAFPDGGASSSNTIAEVDVKLWAEEKRRLAEAFQIQLEEERQRLEKSVQDRMEVEKQKLQAEFEAVLIEKDMAQANVVQTKLTEQIEEERNRLRAEYDAQVEQLRATIQEEMNNKMKRERELTAKDNEEAIHEAVMTRLESILEAQETARRQERDLMELDVKQHMAQMQQEIEAKSALIAEYEARIGDINVESRVAAAQHDAIAVLESNLNTVRSHLTQIALENEQLKRNAQETAAASNISSCELTEQVASLTQALHDKIDLLSKAEAALQTALEDSKAKTVRLTQFEQDFVKALDEERVKLKEAQSAVDHARQHEQAEKLEGLHTRIAYLEDELQAKSGVETILNSSIEAEVARVAGLLSEAESHVKRLTAETEQDAETISQLREDIEVLKQASSSTSESDTLDQLRKELESLQEEARANASVMNSMASLQGELQSLRETNLQAAQAVRHMEGQARTDAETIARLRGDLASLAKAEGEREVEVKEKVIPNHLEKERAKWDYEKQSLQQIHLEECAELQSKLADASARLNDSEQALERQQLELERCLAASEEADARRLMMQNQLDTERASWTEEKHELTAVHFKVQQELETERATRTQLIQEALEQQQLEFETRVDSLRTQWSVEFADGLAKEREVFEAELSGRMKTIMDDTSKNEHDQELAEVTQLRQRIGSLEAELEAIRSLSQSHNDDETVDGLNRDELARITREHREALSAMAADHAEIITKQDQAANLAMKDLEQEWASKLKQAQLAHEDALRLKDQEKHLALEAQRRDIEHDRDCAIYDLRRVLGEQKEQAVLDKARTVESEWALKHQRENRELEEMFVSKLAQLEAAHAATLRDHEVRLAEALLEREAEIRLELAEEFIAKETALRSKAERDVLEAVQAKEREMRHQLENELESVKVELNARLKGREAELKAQAKVREQELRTELEQELKDRMVSTNSELQARLKQKDTELEDRLKQREAQLKEKAEEVVKKRVSREKDKWVAESRKILDEERSRIINEWSIKLEEEQEKHARELGEKVKSMKDKLEDVVKKRVNKAKEKWLEEQLEIFQNELKRKESEWKSKAEEQWKRRLSREKDKWVSESRAVIEEERDRLRGEKRQVDVDWELRFEDTTKALRERIASLEQMLILEQRRMDEERAGFRLRLDNADVTIRKAQTDLIDSEREWTKERLALQARLEELQLQVEKEQQGRKQVLAQQDEATTNRTRHLQEIEQEIRLEREELAKLRETNQVRMTALEEALEFERAEVARFKSRILEAETLHKRERDRHEELTRRMREDSEQRQQLRREHEQLQQTLDKLQRQEAARFNESNALVNRLERENHALREELNAQNELMERVAEGEAQVVQLLKAREEELHLAKAARDLATSEFRAQALNDCITTLDASKKRKYFDAWRSLLQQ